jgi:cyclopropane-fatty-acyl-phospholipid synthase
MLAAIDALNTAAQREELAIKAAKDTAKEATCPEGQAETSSTVAEGARTITLKQRVVPFIDMLRRAHAEDKEVVWGV